MHILNFGSLNIDEIYRVSHLVTPGETVSSVSLQVLAGGKGLNQSIALAKGGASVVHAGCVGADGEFLKDTLTANGVDVSHVHTVDVPSGKAIIQVDDQGQNAILLYPGANRRVDAKYIRKVLSFYGPSDWILMQNEISGVEDVLHMAAERGMHVAFNPSPITSSLYTLPLETVSILFVNEVEGAALSGATQPEVMLKLLREKYPRAAIVLTLGSAGAYYADKEQTIYQEAIPATAVDTTGAGDVFSGFLLAALTKGVCPKEAMYTASLAAALSITKPGASASIPTMDEVTAFGKSL
jgi:ribokinase